MYSYFSFVDYRGPFATSSYVYQSGGYAKTVVGESLCVSVSEVGRSRAANVTHRRGTAGKNILWKLAGDRAAEHTAAA